MNITHNSRIVVEGKAKTLAHTTSCELSPDAGKGKLYVYENGQVRFSVDTGDAYFELPFAQAWNLASAILATLRAHEAHVAEVNGKMGVAK